MSIKMGRQHSLPGMANVITYGADPTGVADSSQAFRDAIASFSPEDDSSAGTVVVPPGTYRLASLVRIKKNVDIIGCNPPGAYSGGCRIKLDPGVSGFVFERYNTPAGTTDSGAGDGGCLRNLCFYNPSHKVDVWEQDTLYTEDDVIKVGPAPGQGAVLLGNNQYSHYRCTTTGTSSASGTGPRSLGEDYVLDYDGLTVAFTIGAVLSQSGDRFATIIADTGTQLRLTSYGGIAFVNNVAITDSSGGAAVADGGSSLAVDDELDGTARWLYIGGGCAIKIRANGVTIENVSMSSISGCGIQIQAQDSEVPAAFANANGWQLINVNISTCDGHGLYVQGSDANGGNWVCGQIGSNGGPASDEEFSGPGFNIFDSSFLGNTYTGIQFYTVGGQGAIFSDSVGGGSTFTGCYVEGSGGGHSIMLGSNTLIGGGLSIMDIRSTGTPSFNASAATHIAPNSAGTGFGQKVKGWGANSWRPNVFIPAGIQRVNGTPSRVYTCITSGITAASGGPTGTSSDITDGTAHWAHTHLADSSDGLIQLGGNDPTYKQFMYFQAPDDVNVGLGTYYRFDSFGSGITNAQAFQYGVSGPLAAYPEGNGTGLAHAVNKTTLSEWPYKVPAGKAIADMIWIGGCRHATSDSATDPTWGTWNPGDEIKYKGAAVTAGGKLGRICTTYGTAGDYTGTLTFDGGTGDFTVGQVVTGTTSGATGLITAKTGSTAAGTLTVKGVAGVFIDNEAITDPVTPGAAVVNGAMTTGLAVQANGSTTIHISNGYINYNGGTVDFTAGQVVTGGTSGAVGTIISISGTTSTGILVLKRIYGTFVDDEVLTDPMGGAAVMDSIIFPALSTLLDQRNIRVGDKLTINGVTSRVQSMSTNGREIVMGSSITSGNDLAVAYSPPIFKEYGSIDP